MTPGVIDPYDMAIRVDLGEIREDDLPKVFSGNAKALAECKRHLYKLRSDRLLYRNAALVDLVQKLKFASDPKTVKAAIAQCVESAQNNIKQSLSDEWKKLDLTKEHITLNGRVPDHGDYKGITYYISATKIIRVDQEHRNMEENVILRIENRANGSDITPMEGWNQLVSKATFDKVVGRVREINKVNENILGTAKRRKVEAEILENETIPFMSKMWAIGVIGDILDMLGKALGGNL